MVKVAASILACNSANLGNSVLEAEKGKADIIHIDIMDGHYVNNLTFGPQTVRDLKRITNLPIEAHLEVSNPDDLIETFAHNGADMITVQLDCCVHPIRIFNRIKHYGKQVGVAINPGTDVKPLQYLLKYIDYVVLMSVEPGFGGQAFEESVYDKIMVVKDIFKSQGKSIPVAVDGGINLDNAEKLKMSGVDILIVGSSIFGSDDIVHSISLFKELRI